MRYSFLILCPLSIAGLTSCESGVRDLDLINKQFQATYNLDSTRTIDSSRLAALRNTKAVYNFSEDGKGTTHLQMGMVSNDIPFTWTIRKDSLTIDQTVYLVRKQDKGLVLVNDSIKLMLSQQP